MPRFYFHLSAPDQDFPDDIGSDVGDLATAHSIAVRLMKRVMMFSSFADCAPRRNVVLRIPPKWLIFLGLRVITLFWRSASSP